MAVLKSWALCVIISALAGTVISLLMPKGSMEKTMRAVVGVFMVSSVCLPLVRLNVTEEIEAVFSASDFGENYAENMGDYVVSEYENTIKEAVESAALESGVSDYEIVADVSSDKNGCIIIHEITVKTEDENVESIAALERLLKEKFGFPVSVRKGN